MIIIKHFFIYKGTEWRGEGIFRSGVQDYSVEDINQNEVVSLLLYRYTEAVRIKRLSPDN